MPPQVHTQSRRPNGPTIAATSTTVTSSQPQSSVVESQANNPPSTTLRLRGQIPVQDRTEPERHIQWAEDVVDNEGMGKKSSKGKD